MMKWLRAANAAMGVRKYIILASATGASVTYSWLSIFLRDHYEFSLPQIPWLAIAVVALLLLFWFLQRLVELEAQVEPKLELKFVDDTHPFSLLDPGVGGAVVRYIRVKVTNSAPFTLTDCTVVLDEFLDKDGNTGFYVPIGLITQHQLWQKREGGPFTLRGGQSKFIEVAAMRESSTDDGIILQYETNTKKEDRYPNTVPAKNGPYRLRLTAYGGGSPTTRWFRLYADENNRLRMTDVD